MQQGADMRAKLSVVIPVLNGAEVLPGCLGALIEGVEAGLIRELVISDGGSTDASLQIARQVGAIVVQGPASRGGQMRRASDVAQGDWLLFLHADTVLPAGWAAVVSQHMASGLPAYFRLGFDIGGVAPRLVAFWANLRSRVFMLPYGDQGLLISRRDYDAVGGFRDIPLMEDVAMARGLGRRLRMLPCAVKTSAARYAHDGWLRRALRNFSLLVRYFAGVDPERLARKY